MRIIFANSFYVPEVGGGAELTLQRIANGMLARGHEVAAFTTGERESVDIVDGVKVYRFPIDNRFRKLDRNLPGKFERVRWQWRDRYSTLMAKRFDAVMRDFAPDIVQYHNLPGLTRSIWEPPLAHGIPTVQVLHDLNLICPNSLMFKDGASCTTRCRECVLFRHGFASASDDVSALVGVSRFVLDRVTGAGLFERSRQGVIYNAQRLPEPSRLVNDGIVRFGFIGALNKPKGIEWLIDQFDDTCGTLTIAGTGSAEYVAQLKERAAGKRISFVGHCPSAEFFPMIDVGIVPSIWHDTLPGVAIEGGAHGRPVIASRRGGLPEIVKDGVTGILVDPEQPDTLGAAIRRLSGDAELRDRMAREAPKAVKIFTSLDRCLDEYEQLYVSLGAG